MILTFVEKKEFVEVTFLKTRGVGRGPSGQKFELEVEIGDDPFRQKAY
jgi:hypothetical protein